MLWHQQSCWYTTKLSLTFSLVNASFECVTPTPRYVPGTTAQKSFKDTAATARRHAYHRTHPIQHCIVTMLRVCVKVMMVMMVVTVMTVMMQCWSGCVRLYVLGMAVRDRKYP